MKDRSIDIALRLANERGWNQTQFGTAMGATPADVTNWKKRGLPTDRLQVAADALDVSVDELLGRAPSAALSMPTGAVPLDTSRNRRVWVVGKGSAGMLPERLWSDSDQAVGDGDEYAEISTSDPHAFLAAVVGTSMVPRYNPGEFALVEPSSTVDIEDDVLVRLTNGQTMIKKLVSMRDGWRFSSYNDLTQLYFTPAEVTWVYYVAHFVPRKKIKLRM